MLDVNLGDHDKALLEDLNEMTKDVVSLSLNDNAQASNSVALNSWTLRR